MPAKSLFAIPENLFLFNKRTREANFTALEFTWEDAEVDCKTNLNIQVDISLRDYQKEPAKELLKKPY